MLTRYKLPSVDIDQLIAAQQKNLEAVAEANRVAVEGVQALGKRQVEVLQETMKETSEAVSSLSKAGSPAELAAKEAELAKSAFEKSVATMREMAEILVKSSQEATDKIKPLLAASLEEICSLGSSTKTTVPSPIASGRLPGRPLVSCPGCHGTGIRFEKKLGLQSMILANVPTIIPQPAPAAFGRNGSDR